jgi:excisionase family DNA binding protein
VKIENNAEQSVEHATDALLDKAEVAARLKKSKRTIDSYMRSKKLPYIKFGRAVLFHWPDVLAKLRQYRVN